MEISSGFHSEVDYLPKTAHPAVLFLLYHGNLSMTECKIYLQCSLLHHIFFLSIYIIFNVVEHPRIRLVPVMGYYVTASGSMFALDLKVWGFELFLRPVYVELHVLSVLQSKD